MSEKHRYSGLTDTAYFEETDQLTIDELLERLGELPPPTQIAILNDTLFHAMETGDDLRASQILDRMQALPKT